MELSRDYEPERDQTNIGHNFRRKYTFQKLDKSYTAITQIKVPLWSKLVF